VGGHTPHILSSPQSSPQQHFIFLLWLMKREKRSAAWQDAKSDLPWNLRPALCMHCGVTLSSNSALLKHIKLRPNGMRACGSNMARVPTKADVKMKKKPKPKQAKKPKLEELSENGSPDQALLIEAARSECGAGLVRPPPRARHLLTPASCVLLLLLHCTD
jgi:hypothetical protein